MPMICYNTENFKINVMKEISQIGSDLSTMCRICLSSDVTLSDIFCFSSKMENTVAGVIMKCAAVQITRGEEMPNNICELCCIQLEKTHDFVMQIEHADRTLRRHFQQLHDSDKPVESAVHPSEDPLIFNINKVKTKCESLDINDVFYMDLSLKRAGPGNYVQENNKEIISEIKVEPVDDNLFVPTECEAGSEDLSSNIDGKEQENSSFSNQFMEEIYLKVEINDEEMDENLIIQTESVDDTINASSNGDGNKIRCNISTTRKKNKNKLKSYQCDICDKCFGAASSLHYHKRTHTGEKPYKCNICAMCFSQSQLLNRHKLKHTGEKPYQCDFCMKCFSQSSTLNYHRRIHTGEKPYRCDVCNKCFSRSSSLNTHKLTHTGEKPYQCDLCNKCFSHVSSLYNHKRNFCNQTFSQTSKLK